MTKQHLSIEGYWNVVIVYDVWPHNLDEVAQILRTVGAPWQMVDDAVKNLRDWNAGYTLTSMGQRISIICIGRTTSLREFFNTVDHEIDHLQTHVAEYYDVSLGTEEAAYLQGYVGGRIFEFVYNYLNI